VSRMLHVHKALNCIYHVYGLRRNAMLYVLEMAMSLEFPVAGAG